MQPPPGPWRASGRLLLVTPDGRVPLLRSFDPLYPEVGEWWEVPGGGLEPGEDTATAAVRELAEETGLLVPREALSAPVWTASVTYAAMGERRWSTHTVHLAELPSMPRGDLPLRRTDEERTVIVAVDWIPVGGLGGLRRTFPDGVDRALDRLRSGESVADGLSVWS